MNWLQEINSFPKFDLNIINPYIYNDDKLKANSKYNKALKNASEDSVDIAIIELRKLSVLYPEVGQISLLLGCCQMLDGKPVEALKNFKKARAGSLPLDLEPRAEQYLEESKTETEKSITSQSFSSNKKYLIPSSPAIVEATPARWRKTRVASKREQREVMKQLDFAKKEETYVSEHRRVNWIKVVIVTVMVFILIGLTGLFVFYLPAAFQSLKASETKTSGKLDWLLNKLTQESSQDPGIQEILNEYDEMFYPEEPVSQEEISQELSSVDPTVTSPLTPTTLPSDNERVLVAAREIEEADSIGNEDPKQVYILITSAMKHLEGIDENAIATGLNITAAEISIQALQLEKSVVNVACYQLYKDGRTQFDAQNYTESIALLARVFDINPYYLDGGNAYNLGKAYAAAGDQEKANEAFRFVVDNYPGTDRADWATARIEP